jgi:hypothetical protein
MTPDEVMAVMVQAYPMAGTFPTRPASAEDTIVAKLKWYQAMGGSKRQ